MWFEDLSECDYFSRVIHQPSIAVGWLENEKSYSIGKAPNTLLEKLNEFIKTRAITHAFLGVHECDLCIIKLPSGQLNIIDGFGSRTTFLAYKNKLYIFPDLIIHYINEHSYLPPAEFIEAALDSTPQETIEYLNRILNNGRKNK